MRLIITLEPVKTPFIVPVHYNYMLQSFIYRHLFRSVAKQLHEIGFPLGKRTFRLFVFSRLFGEFKRVDDKFLYNGRVSFQIASPKTELLSSFVSCILKNQFKFGNNLCNVINIEVKENQLTDQEMLIKAISPITVYRTLLTPEKKKKTYYYSPFEKEFSQLCHQNLLKKYQLVKNEPFPEHNTTAVDFAIIPEKVSKKNEHIILYKDTVIKAWSGIYCIKGSPELLKIAFDCGLGAKNSQGFGMIECYKQ